VQCAGVGGPRRAVEEALEHVVEVLSGHEVLDPQREALVTGEVGRVGQQPPVGRHLRHAELEEVVPLGQDVAVEYDLLARQRAAVALRRGDPVAGHGGAAGDGVLLALFLAGVIPVAALAYRHRQVGLLGTPFDLGEDLVPQRLLAGGDLLRVRVLRFEICDRVGVFLVQQPGVFVDYCVPVPFTYYWHTLRDWLVDARRVGRPAVHGGDRVGVSGVLSRSIGHAMRLPTH
jgi:hypothetical protein